MKTQNQQSAETEKRVLFSLLCVSAAFLLKLYCCSALLLLLKKVLIIN